MKPLSPREQDALVKRVLDPVGAGVPGLVGLETKILHHVWDIATDPNTEVGPASRQGRKSFHEVGEGV